MKIAISQSNYIPWAGYFGVISQCDVLVFLDDVQFTSRDWRSRNRIKTADGLKWLSIPVGDSLSRRICDVKLPNTDWKKSHKSSIMASYRDAKNFQAGVDLIETIYGEFQLETLSDFNQSCTKFIAREILGLNCRFLDSREITHAGTGSDRVLSICKSLSATKYVSGPSAASYLKVDDFSINDIEVVFVDYSKMSSYEQLHGDFSPNVSIIDMVFNVASDYSKLIEIDTFTP
jgi:hypothetical protein